MKESFSFSFGKEEPEDDSPSPEETPKPEGELTTQELLEALDYGSEFKQKELSLLESFRSANPKLTKVLALSTLLSTTLADPMEKETKVGERSEAKYVETQPSPEPLNTKENTISYREARQATEEFTTEGNAERRQELLHQTKGVILRIIKDGTRTQEFFSASDLISGKVKEIQGYITGLQIQVPPGLETRVNNQELNRVEQNETEEDMELRRIGDLYGYSGLPHEQNQTVTLELDDGSGDPVEIRFSHDTFRKQGEVHVPTYEIGALDGDTLSSYIDTTHIVYIGMDEPEVKEIPDLEEKFRLAGYSVADVESTFETNMIDSLGVVGYERENAVMQYNNERIMFFFKPYISDISAEQTVTIARHEALHMLDYDRKYSEHSRLRELFADLHGISEGTNIYQQIMKKGELDHGLNHVVRTSKFFNTIDESNFISGARGGHSWESTREFTATFMNGLHYLDNLPRVLLNLKTKEREQFISNYRQTLQTFLKISRQEAKDTSERYWPDAKFFKEKKHEFETRLAKWRLLQSASNYEENYHE